MGLGYRAEAESGSHGNVVPSVLKLIIGAALGFEGQMTCNSGW